MGKHTPGILDWIDGRMSVGGNSADVAYFRECVKDLIDHSISACDSLEAEIASRYGGMLDIAEMRRRYDRDMQDVIDLRVAIRKATGESHG